MAKTSEGAHDKHKIQFNPHGRELPWGPKEKMGHLI